MAEGVSNVQLDAEDDLLFCSVCMEEYEDPRALPCLHTFCYKCLVQLSETQNKVDPSDIEGDIEFAAQKAEVSPSASATIPPKADEQACLKCPLCLEEHVIDKVKGVGAFRKDFRIGNMAEQQRLKNTGSMLQSFDQTATAKFTEDQDEMGQMESMKSVEEEEVEVLSEKCLHHPNETLLYHCESDSCKFDICGECWGTTHDNHIVKLLSKKVNSAKEALLEEMENNIYMVSSQIDALSSTQENTSQQNEEILLEIKQKQEDVEEKLQNTLKNTSQEFNIHRKLQEKKISDELQNLSSLQETLMQINDGLDKENLPPSSNAFKKYAGMQTKMEQLTQDLEEWGFSFNKALLEPYKSSDEIPKPVSVKFEEATVHANTQDVKEYDEGYDDENYDEEYNEDEERCDHEEYDEENEQDYNDEDDDEYYPDDEDYPGEDDDEEENYENEEHGETGDTEDDTDVPQNACSRHKREQKYYFCKTCNYDICKECWSDIHEDHIVKLLSKEDKDTKNVTKAVQDAPMHQAAELLAKRYEDEKRKRMMGQSLSTVQNPSRSPGNWNPPEYQYFVQNPPPSLSGWNRTNQPVVPASPTPPQSYPSGMNYPPPPIPFTTQPRSPPVAPAPAPPPTFASRIATIFNKVIRVIPTPSERVRHHHYHHHHRGKIPLFCLSVPRALPHCKL